MNEEYSKRELDHMFAEHEKLDGIRFNELHEKLDLIISQTTKTNGRVSSLEKWKYGVGVGIGVLAVSNYPALMAVAKAFAQ